MTDLALEEMKRLFPEEKEEITENANEEFSGEDSIEEEYNQETEEELLDIPTFLRRQAN